MEEVKLCECERCKAGNPPIGPVEYGYCHDRCGLKTSVITKTVSAQHRYKGNHSLFIAGHYIPVSLPDGSTKRRKGTGPKYDCPFSRDMLHDLYWRNRVTSTQIAQLAAMERNWTKVPSSSVVARWLRDAEISVKSMREAKLTPEAKATARAHCKIMNERVRELVKMGEFTGGNGDVTRLQTKSARRKMAASKRRRVMVKCCYQPCGICGAGS